MRKYCFLIRERIEPTFSGSSSVRFDFIFEKPVRVRFGSTDFSKSRFKFGSVRFRSLLLIFTHFLKLVRFGSTEFSKSQFEFGSVRLHF